MAGSKKWMVYQADDLAKYAVQIDESNGEVADFDDYTALDNLPLLPSNTTMRYVNCKRDGANRKIWVGKPTSGLVTGSVVSLLLSSFGVGDFAISVAWAVFSYVSQAISGRRPQAGDTGILDGDAS
jgi:hypothetical protein